MARIIFDEEDDAFFIFDDDAGDHHGPFESTEAAQAYADENDMEITD